MLKLLTNIKLKNAKIIIVGILSTALGFHMANAFNSLGNFIFAMIGALLAFSFCGVAVQNEMDDLWKYTDKPFYQVKKMRHQDPTVRLSAYLLCICVLYTVSALSIAIASAGADAGDREESTGLVATEDVPPAPYYKQRQWHYNMFIALLSPALLGVRYALGEPNKNRK